MPKTARKDPAGDRHQLTVRIPKPLNARLEAYAVALDRTYREIAESAIDTYLKSIKLTADQKRKVSALLGE
jgi:predicted transcriptional regulator